MWKILSGEHCPAARIGFVIWITCGSGHSSIEESDRAMYGGGVLFKTIILSGSCNNHSITAEPD